MNDNSDNEMAVALDDFIGQKKLVDALNVSIAAAKMRNEPIGHILLTGPIGSGKSTLANAIAIEMNANIKKVSFNSIKKEGDLAALLTNISEGDILLAENIDCMRSTCMELLVSALDDFSLEIEIGKGPAARSIRFPLPAFTLIAVKNSNYPLPEKLKSCFFMNWRMEEYSFEELSRLSKVHASQMQVDLTDEAAEILAVKSNGSQRQMINTLKRARDFALIKGNGIVDSAIVKSVICLIEL